MVSRTKQQHRPQSTSRALESTYDAHNGGQRRAQSSMRHQSNVRPTGGRHSMGDAYAQPSYSHGQQSSSQGMRPRAISASRIRQPSPAASTSHHFQRPGVDEDDPTEVARQILDLRERREASFQAKIRNPSPMQIRPSHSGSGRSAGGKSAGSGGTAKGGACPAGRVLTPALSQEEIRAEERLTRAESKITGLLEELDELKFFQELENEPVTPRTPGRDKTPNRDRTPTPSKTGVHVNTSVNTPRAPGPSTAAGVPLNIRTVSPARGRLPPPPPTSTNAKTPSNYGGSRGGGGLETYKPMSPRRIAKLDRNSLELECQTLVRKIQLIEQERNSQSATIEMYEISLQESDTEKAKVKKLESQLAQVSGELKRQLANIQKGKHSLVKDYEDKLQANLHKLHRITEMADSYKMDMEVAKADADRCKQELDKFKNQFKQEKTCSEELKSREAVLELQLTEARNLNEALVKKIEKKRAEVTGLKNDLDQTQKFIQDSTQDRDDAYEKRISALEQQLDISKERCSRLEQESASRNDQLLQKDNELDLIRAKEADQSAKINMMETRINELEQEAQVKFEEGKKASKTMETRKMQELVADRAKQTREYESRIKAMQEQLKHQSDRHHSDIQESRKRNDQKLEAMRDEIKEEIRLQEGAKVARLETELSKLRRDYDDAKTDFAMRLKEAQQKARETAADFQHQDQVRQQEIDHMHNRLENYSRELADKEAKITELSEQFEANRKKYFEETESMRTKHMAEAMKRDEEAEEQRVRAKEMELDLTEQLETMKQNYDDLEQSLKQQAEELQLELDNAKRKLSESQEVAKENQGIKQRVEEVQAEFDRVQQDLQTERERNDEVESELRVELAKMEGKLRASESALKTKKARVHELEDQLDLATSTTSKLGEEKESAVSSLRRELEDVTNKFENERSKVQDIESARTRMRTEMATLQDKLKAMGRLEDAVKDMQRRASSVEQENQEKAAELAKITKSYEETRHKLLEAEQRFTMAKNDLESHVDKNDKMVERYDKTIQDLEFKLEKERDTNSELQTSIDDMQRSIDSLERQKVRKETELGNLRKDYEDLSTLLEENLHSSAKKDEIDGELRRKQREMSETVQIYNQQVLELEEKLKKETENKNSFQIRVNQLDKSLEKLEDEKRKLSSELASTRQKHELTVAELQDFKQQHEQSKGGIEKELGRKERHIRDAVQRYTRRIADLESKLEEEVQLRIELEDRLASARNELEDKQQKTQELIQKHTKHTLKLESDLRSSALEKEGLNAKLEQTTKDLDEKRRQLKQTVSKYSNEFAQLHEKQEHNNDDNTNVTRSELERTEREMNELKSKIPQLLSDLDMKSREVEEHKAAVKRFETELGKRKEQMNDLVSRYTGQIADLEAQLDEQSVARSTTKNHVETVKLDASRKDKKIKDLMKKVADLESKLEVSNRNSDLAEEKAEEILKNLDEKESELRHFEMEKIELETKLHTQSRAKDEMRAKVTDLSSKLERKERELRESTDRYKMYIMELESKLDQDTDAKHYLQVEVDRMKSNLNNAASAANEANELREKVYSLEKALDSYRGKARDIESKSKDSVRSLQEKLDNATKEKSELEFTLKKVNGEKAEVISALEGVINEVQNREDEIESLSDILQRRDEELEHAKIIATKALQSAKDIQKRYKEKEKDRDSGVMGRIDQLSDNVDSLTTQNETLQRKISMLERELRDKNLECKRLKDQLRQIDGPSLRDTRDREPMKDDVSAFTSSTFESSRVDSFPNPASSGSMRSTHSHGLNIKTGNSMDPDGIEMSVGSFSPNTSPRSPDGMFNREVEFPAFEDNAPTYSSDGANSTILTQSEVGGGWAHDFDSESRTSGFDSYASDPHAQSTSSRRSIERDALRKYVRSRYSSKR